MKPTSIKSYHECLESGHISKQEAKVLEVLKNSKPLTARELTYWVPGAWRRMRSLMDKGLVDGSSTTKCPVTNKVVTLYKYCDTPLLPMVKYRRPTYRELEARVRELEQIINKGE